MRTRNQIPRDKIFDSSLLLLKDGYRYISNRCAKLGSNVVRTRLLLKETILMKGEPQARIFYDNRTLKREGVMPGLVQKTLLGEGGVQGMDGEAHQARKAMFLSLTPDAEAAGIAAQTERLWPEYAAKWEQMKRVVLHEEALELLTRVVCAWAGVPLPEADVERRTDDIKYMIDGPGTISPRHWRGRLGRRRSEAWLEGLIEQVRSGELSVPRESALSVIARHRDIDGERMSLRVAAVELLNLLRPTVAIAWYITFAALAKHEYPRYHNRLLFGDDREIEAFVHEVRRYYPFFPFVAAEVAQAFESEGYTFSHGSRVLLDLYGTNHDEGTWDDPETFRAERFDSGTGSPYALIPQGGGDQELGHRCPGEGVTVEVMKVAIKFLSRSIDYEVPEQDLSFKMWRMPALPRSGFVMTRVRRVRQG